MAMRGAIHHIDLNASDLAASKRVYALLLEALGYRCVRDDAKACEWDWNGGDAFASVGLKQARPGDAAHAHRRYAPGLHHLAWEVESRDTVDMIFRMLADAGVTVLDSPADYPEYSADYYAAFFEDPDGIKLEIVHAPSFSKR